MEGKLIYRGKEIKFNLTYKKVRRIYLRIKYPDKIFITCSRRVPLNDIYSFLERKGDWILKGLERYEKMPHFEETLKNFDDGEELLLLGKMLKIQNVASQKFFIDFDDQFLYIHRSDKRGIKKRFEEWQREFGKVVINELTKQNFKKFEKLDFKICFPSVTLKSMKARWGSCNYKKGEIKINKVLMKVEKPLIDFVLCHEIAHLVYPCHDKNFYNLLTAILPDWRERKKVLNFKYFTLLED